MKGNVSDINVNLADGAPQKLQAYKGQVALIVNLASKCGFTPQYSGLESLYQKYKDRNFVVLGFPCNDFGGQEPGTIEEIQQFCSTKYGVTFPLFDKVHAKGTEQHPLYARLTEEASPAGEVRWNFEKFLIDRQGNIVARFESKVAPDAPDLISTIESELEKGA